MANIFNEVDEDIRKERYQSLWNKYGKYLVGFIILIIVVFSLSQFLKSKNIAYNKEILDLYFSSAENIEKNQIDFANQELEAIYIKKNKTHQILSIFVPKVLVSLFSYVFVNFIKYICHGLLFLFFYN